MGDKEDMEKLERLKAIRRANRGVITKKIFEADEILSRGGTLNDDDVTALDVLDRLLKNKLKLVEDLDQNILSLCDVGSISNEVEESETVLKRVVSCQKRIQDILQRRNNESNALKKPSKPYSTYVWISSTYAITFVRRVSNQSEITKVNSAKIPR